MPIAADQVTWKDWDAELLSLGYMRDADGVLGRCMDLRDTFGYSVTQISDLDGDDMRDFLIADPLEINPSTNEPTGCVRVYSGMQFKELYTVWGDQKNDQYGKTMCMIGDVDEDGINDFVVGGGGPGSWSGRLHVRSGRSGDLIRQQESDYLYDSGIILCSAGDLDRDGCTDFCVGFPDFDLWGQDRGGVLVISSKTGKFIEKLLGESAGENFGFALDCTKDLDGDGVSDLVIGAVNGNIPRRSFSQTPGIVRVFSGKSFEQLFEVKGENGFDCFGFTVTGISDWDGDGGADFAIGAPGNIGMLLNSRRAPRSPAHEHGYVQVFSGKFGRLLAEITGKELNVAGIGYGICETSDFDGDSVKDLLFSAYPRGGLVAIGSMDKDRKWSRPSGGVGKRERWIGASMGLIGDIDTDGIMDLLVSDVSRCYCSAPYEGVVSVLSGASGQILRQIQQ